MVGEQFLSLFRALVDDPDKTFFSNTDVQNALQLGYNEFRRIVTTECPEVYEQIYQVTISTAALNLDTVMFGPTTSQPPCQRISRVEMVDPNGFVTQIIKPVTTIEQLLPNYGWQLRWCLQGRILRFNVPVIGTVSIQYTPESTLNWATIAVPGSTVYVDDLGQWHDIIVYLAVQQYAIKDWAQNPILQQQLNRRMLQFTRFLGQSRSGDGARWVTEESADGIM